MQPAGTTAIADDVRLSFVASLYLKRGTLFAGMIAHVVAAMAIYLRIDDPFYLYAGMALFLIWAIRALNMHLFDKLDKSKFTLSHTLRWEKPYVIGSFVTCSLLGMLCVLAFGVTQDPLAGLGSIPWTLAR